MDGPRKSSPGKKRYREKRSKRGLSWEIVVCGGRLVQGQGGSRDRAKGGNGQNWAHSTTNPNWPKLVWPKSDMTRSTTPKKKKGPLGPSRKKHRT